MRAVRPSSSTPTRRQSESASGMAAKNAPVPHDGSRMFPPASPMPRMASHMGRAISFGV